MDLLENRRINVVMPYIKGKLLDIGCGYNNLVKKYGNGIGVDVYPWREVDLVVKKTSSLPFENSSFDTITFLACLNHIPYRQDALKEARRLLKPGGTLLITMISPFIGKIAHIIFKQDERARGVSKGEKEGLGDKEVIDLLDKAGFVLVKKKYFEFFMNKLYIAKIKNI